MGGARDDRGEMGRGGRGGLQVGWRSARNCRLTSRSSVGTNMERSCGEAKQENKPGDQFCRRDDNVRETDTGHAVRCGR